MLTLKSYIEYDFINNLNKYIYIISTLLLDIKNLESGDHSM
jgi:hypothetical protein